MKKLSELLIRSAHPGVCFIHEQACVRFFYLVPGHVDVVALAWSWTHSAAVSLGQVRPEQALLVPMYGEIQDTATGNKDSDRERERYKTADKSKVITYLHNSNIQFSMMLNWCYTAGSKGQLHSEHIKHVQNWDIRCEFVRRCCVFIIPAWS